MRNFNNVDKKYPGYFDDDQLYDLKSDSNEQVNLAGNTAYAEKLQEMKNLLKQHTSGLPHRFEEFNDKD